MFRLTTESFEANSGLRQVRFSRAGCKFCEEQAQSASGDETPVGPEQKQQRLTAGPVCGTRANNARSSDTDGGSDTAMVARAGKTDRGAEPEGKTGGSEERAREGGNYKKQKERKASE
ncbi:hypothetical protein GCM10011313_09670 [Mycetocola zhadangensis]|nr:hypothetical protein GCM10011313_09670 [Mycetocola zhadangensis]